TGNIVTVQRSFVSLCSENTVVSLNPIVWLSQVRVCIKAGIQKRDRDAASGETLVRVHSQSRRQHKIVLLENTFVRLNLSLRPVEDFDAGGTDLFGRGGIGFQDLANFGWDEVDGNQLAGGDVVTHRADVR